MASYRWHWHLESTRKDTATKEANRLRRRSAWRGKPWFKVRVRKTETIAPRSGKKVKYYIVEWYGPSSAM